MIKGLFDKNNKKTDVKPSYWKGEFLCSFEGRFFTHEVVIRTNEDSSYEELDVCALIEKEKKLLERKKQQFSFIVLKYVQKITETEFYRMLALE
jgi:hypothetical protein